MADEILKRDPNHVTVLAGVTDDVNQDVTMLRVDPTTKRLLVSATGGGGGGMVIGDPVVGGDPNRVLFIDGSGDLAQSPNFIFDDSLSAFQKTLSTLQNPDDLSHIHESGVGLDLVGFPSLTFDGIQDYAYLDLGGGEFQSAGLSSGAFFGSEIQSRMARFSSGASGFIYDGVTLDPNGTSFIHDNVDTVTPANSFTLGLDLNRSNGRTITTSAFDSTYEASSIIVVPTVLTEITDKLGKIDFFGTNEGYLSFFEDPVDGTYNWLSGVLHDASLPSTTGYFGYRNPSNDDGKYLAVNTTDLALTLVEGSVVGTFGIDLSQTSALYADTALQSKTIWNINGVQDSFDNGAGVTGIMSLDVTQSKLEHANTTAQIEGGFAISDSLTAASFVDNGVGTVAQTTMSNQYAGLDANDTTAFSWLRAGVAGAFSLRGSDGISVNSQLFGGPLGINATYTTATDVTEFDMGSAAKSALKYTNTAGNYGRMYVSGDRAQSEFQAFGSDVATYNIQNAQKSELGWEDSLVGNNSYARVDGNGFTASTIDGINVLSQVTTSTVGTQSAFGDGTVSATSNQTATESSIQFVDGSDNSKISTDGHSVIRDGGIIDTRITTVAYGSTTNLTADDYDIEVTGSTGATTINLPTGTNAPIGTVYIISDLDAIALTSNITIDAGASNTINGATIAQTYVIAVSGHCVTLKKITATKWKLQ